MKKIMFLPLDERPCNYNFAKFMLEGNEEIELVIPPLEILGRKKEPANFEAIKEFLLSNAKDCYGVILSIDMLLYGGIVPSRLHYFTKEYLCERLSVVRALRETNPSIKIFTFALIMRCPQYSSSDEEPDYYEICGYDIFKYGEIKHKISLGVASDEEKAELPSRYEKCKDYFDDYVSRRAINSDMNIEVVKLLHEGIIDFLVIPQDDSSLYGLIANDQEKIFGPIKEMHLEDKVLIYPGADEVGMVLVSRMVNHINGVTPKIYVEYSTEHGHLFVPMFEDREVYKTVAKQIASSGCVLCDRVEEADGILMMNNPTLELVDANITEAEHQCDVLKEDVRDIAKFVEKVKSYVAKGYRVSIADVALINRADNELIEEMSRQDIFFELAGYSGWNTSSNTLGTALTHLVLNINYGFTTALEKHLALRIYEDAGYCGHTRKFITENRLPELGLGYFSSGEVKGVVSQMVWDEINNYIKGAFPQVYEKYMISDCYMPWCRMFEVALTVIKR